MSKFKLLFALVIALFSTLVAEVKAQEVLDKHAFQLDAPRTSPNGKLKAYILRDLLAPETKSWKLIWAGKQIEGNVAMMQPVVIQGISFAESGHYSVILLQLRQDGTISGASKQTIQVISVFEKYGTLIGVLLGACLGIGTMFLKEALEFCFSGLRNGFNIKQVGLAQMRSMLQAIERSDGPLANSQKMLSALSAQTGTVFRRNKLHEIFSETDAIVEQYQKRTLTRDVAITRLRHNCTCLDGVFRLFSRQQ